MNTAREPIIKTAHSLFLQKSYKAVTLQEIVEKTGVTKGAFYHHFKSKHDVFKAVVNHYYAQMLTTPYADYSKESLYRFIQDVLTDIESMYNAMYEHHGEGLMAFRVEIMRVFPEFKAVMQKHMQREQAAWEEIIALAKQRGEIKTTLPDDAVANLFIRSQDGNAVFITMLTKEPHEAKAKMRMLWEALYASLKV